MRVTLVNQSNKARSKKARNELKEFARDIVNKLGISQNIRHIKLRYTKQFYGYYPKNKPLAGFFKAYKDGVVQIDFTGWWDRSQADRKIAIIHELTHAKQMIEKRLVVYKNGRQLKWNGKYTNCWKKFKLDLIEDMSEDELEKYIRKHLPWEREVYKNCERLMK